MDERIWVFEKKLAAASRDHAWAHALSIFQEMLWRKVRPSAGCHSALLASWSKSSKWQEALAHFSNIRERDPTAGGRSVVNAAIAACARGALWSEALGLLFFPPGAKDPDAVSFVSATDACAKALQWSRALQLLQDAHRAGLGPTTNALVAALCGQVGPSLWPRALDLLAWANSLNIEVSTAAINAAASACGVNGEWAMALALLGRAQRMGPSPTTISYNTILDACVLAGNWEVALAVFKDLKASKLTPSFITYTTLMSVFANAGRWEEALCQLGIMSRAAVMVDTIGLNAAMTACSKARQWEITLGLLSRGLNLGLKPTTTSFMVAIASLQEGSSWELTLRLFSTCMEMRLSLDPATFRATVTALSLGSALEAALECHRLAEDLGCFKRSTSKVLDLHDLSAQAAKVAVCSKLLEISCTSQPEPVLSLVVGRASHSPGGIGALMPAVQELLLEELVPPIEVSVSKRDFGVLLVHSASVQK